MTKKQKLQATRLVRQWNEEEEEAWEDMEEFEDVVPIRKNSRALEGHERRVRTRPTGRDVARIKRRRGGENKP